MPVIRVPDRRSKIIKLAGLGGGRHLRNFG
jgi:hypothetical protein